MARLDDQKEVLKDHGPPTLVFTKVNNRTFILIKVKLRTETVLQPFQAGYAHTRRHEHTHYTHLHRCIYKKKQQQQKHLRVQTKAFRETTHNISKQ